MSESLSVEEKWVLDDLVKAWDGFIRLHDHHPDDVEEFRRAIHAAQNIIAFRVARRVNPEVWSNTVEYRPAIEAESLRRPPRRPGGGSNP